jgi:predicted aspartyl protease
MRLRVLSILFPIGVLLSGCGSPGNFDAARAYYSKPPTISFSAPEVVPLVVGSEGRLYMQVRIGTQDVMFLVDTGATATICDEQVISEAKIATMAAPFGTLWGGGGGVKSSVARIPTLQIGNTHILDCPVFVQNLDDWNKREVATQKRRIDGILGSELMELLGVQIDYRSHTMQIQKPYNNSSQRHWDEAGLQGG